MPDRCVAALRLSNTRSSWKLLRQLVGVLQELQIAGINFKAFDLGGHEIARRVWKDYYAKVSTLDKDCHCNSALGLASSPPAPCPCLLHYTRHASFCQCCSWHPLRLSAMALRLTWSCSFSRDMHGGQVYSVLRHNNRGCPKCRIQAWT